MNVQVRTVDTSFEVELQRLERLLAAIAVEGHTLVAHQAPEHDNRWVASWRFCQH